MKKLTKTNQGTVDLISEIKIHASKEGSGFWKRIGVELSKSTRRMRTVNIDKINKYSKDKEVVIVPGKVLSLGEMDHDITVVALKFSEKALDKLKHTMTIKQLLSKNPKGKDVRIIG